VKKSERQKESSHCKSNIARQVTQAMTRLQTRRLLKAKGTLMNSIISINKVSSHLKRTKLKTKIIINISDG
jgi:hypothetical protein